MKVEKPNYIEIEPKKYCYVCDAPLKLRKTEELGLEARDWVWVIINDEKYAVCEECLKEISENPFKKVFELVEEVYRLKQEVDDLSYELDEISEKFEKMERQYRYALSEAEDEIETWKRRARKCRW